MRVAGLLIKSVIETIKDGLKELRGGFLTLLLGTLGTTLLEHVSTGKRVKVKIPDIKWRETLPTSTKIPGRGVMREYEGGIAINKRIRARYD